VGHPDAPSTSCRLHLSRLINIRKTWQSNEPLDEQN
jgi:hypothetical protein